MRIGILASVGLTLDSFFPELVEEFNRLGATVHTGASTDSSVGQFSRLDLLSRNPRPRNVLAPSQVERWTRDNQLDVVLTNTATASAIARVGVRSAPLIYFCHGLHWNSGKGYADRVWQVIESSLLRRTDAVVTINSDDEEWFEGRMGKKPILRLDAGVGVPLNLYPWSPVAEAPSASVLWAGEFSRRKRPWYAIEVIQQVRKTVPDVHLTMIGDGPLIEETRDQVKHLGLEAHVSLPGRRPIRSYLEENRALLHTAEWEGLPRVGLEAAAMGRRTYGFDVKGVRNLPQAKLAPEGNVFGLSNLLSSDLKGESLGCQIDAHEREQLSSVNVARQLYSFCQFVSRGS